MKKVIKLTESDLKNIVRSILNEKRMSASELIKDMTLRDIVDVVNSFSNKQISVKEVKEKIEYMFRPSGGRMNENMEDENGYDMEDENDYDEEMEDTNEDDILVPGTEYTLSNLRDMYDQTIKYYTLSDDGSEVIEVNGIPIEEIVNEIFGEY